jgi:tol-pal system protein YbgF
MKIKQLLIILLSAVLAFASNAKDISIQQRLANLETLVNQQSGNRTGVADLVIQNQKLQQQLAQLEGVIEEQNHQIQSLKEKQKLLYIDIDSRLTELEANAKQTTLLNDQPTIDTVDSPAQTVAIEKVQNTLTTQTIAEQPVISSAQDDYDIAFAHLRAGRFLESARAFESFIQKFPNNELTDNAYYWLGESYYVKRQYPQALSAFQSLTSKFPNSSKAPDSWLKIGYSYYEMDDFANADENLNKVINNYPSLPIARLAKNRLQQLHRDH